MLIAEKQLHVIIAIADATATNTDSVHHSFAISLSSSELLFCY